MSGQSQSYTRYGSFILFRKLEESSLAEIWRAAPIDGNSVGPQIALFRFTGGDVGALKRAAEQAAKSLKTIEGSTIVKNQTYHLVGKTPVITWDYEGGRSLFHMVEVSRGGPELPPNPFPIDQALAITEKLALSLETTGHLKHGGQRLHHGILIPQMIWVSEDGDVRTFGHQLTKGMLASLSRSPVQKQFGGFVAPELRRNGESTDPSEVWAVGANLYAMLTGNFLDAPTDQAAMDATLSEAALATDEPIPDAVREVLAKSLAIDPAKRYESPAAVREAIGSLIHGGEYAPTTFNLAFYIHNLLREEFEAEAKERENEKGVDPSLIPSPTAAAQEPAAEESAEEMTPPVTATGAATPARTEGRNRLPLIAAIIVLLLIGGGAAAYWFTVGPGGSSSEPVETADAATPGAAADVAPPRSPQEPVVEPLVAVTDTGDEGVEVEATTDGETSAPSEEELRQKMIQEEIDRRLQAEIMKLQNEYDRKLREERAKQQQREEPVRQKPAETKQAVPPATQTSTAPSKPPQETGADTKEPAAPVTDTAATSTTQTATPPQTATTPPAQPPAPEPPATKEGDLVEIAEVDTPPKLLKRVEPQYPRLAARQKVEATIFLSALVSETGKVLDVKVLRGDRRKLGFDEAAIDAISKSTFQPAMKDGKRVRTWMPVPVFFKTD